MELGKWNTYVAQFWQEIFKVAVYPDEIEDWIHHRETAKPCEYKENF